MNYINNGENSTYECSRNEEVQGLYTNTLYTLYYIIICTTKECENCGDMGVVFCEQCIHNYCKPCSETCHKHPTRRDHNIRKFLSAQSTKGMNIES